MKRVVPCILMLLVLAGCGTHRHDMVFADGQKALEPSARYTVGTVSDATGFTFPEGQEGLDITHSMKTALAQALHEEGLLSDDQAAYRIDVTVNHYDPGNAFGRWLMPGVGSTRIETSSVITRAESPVGTLSTRNTIDAGGAFTVGAWKSIFKKAAAEIITELKESMGLIQEKKKQKK